MQICDYKKKLLAKFPQIRQDYDISKVSWFQAGGTAEMFFKPQTKQELKDFLEFCPQEVPIFTFGVGSNIIIRDGGIRGVVIRLGREFALCEIKTKDTIYAGAACLDVNLAQFAMQNSLSGLEFFSGIPGTIGGAVKMNAGAYGVETKDVLIESYAYDLAGNYHVISAADMDFSYRHSNPKQKDLIFIGALFKVHAGKQDEIKERMEEIARKREDSQPIREKTGGSTFKNPDNKKAWQLIDEAGCRGLNLGEAMISEKHCNFLINTGNARASDLENLGDLVKKKVKEKTGVELKWEIKLVGEKDE